MTQTYKQLQRQIEALQRQADALKQKEVKGVVDRIKVAIAHYGLTAEQLGLGASNAATKMPRSSVKSAGAAPTAKYADGQGNVWSGRGPRPHWLRDALSAGRDIGEFLSADASSASSTPAAKGKSKAKPAKKRATKFSYRDQAGHTWSGMGPRPRWLKEALEAGQTLEQLTV